MKNDIIYFLKQNGYAVVIAIWLFFEIVWYVCFGVHFDLEARKYIHEAQYLLQYHQLSQTRYIFYFTTTAVIAFSLATGLGLHGALLIIASINLLGYLCFYKALKKLFLDEVVPIMVVGVLLSFWPYQSWSLYLFTECLFYSIVLLLFAHLILYTRLNSSFIGVLGLLLFLLIISRPLGILFLPPAIMFVFVKLNKRQRIFFVGLSLFFLILLNFVVQIVFTTTPDWNMTRALTENSIICDMPRNEMPVALDLSHHPNQLYQLFYFMFHNLSHFLQLAFTRLGYFFGMIREYYSPMHNAYLLAMFCFFYGSIVFGVRKIIKTFPLGLAVFVFTSVFFFAAAISLQCDDYHNRFALTLTPFYVTLTFWVWSSFLNRRFFKTT